MASSLRPFNTGSIDGTTRKPSRMITSWFSMNKLGCPANEG